MQGEQKGVRENCSGTIDNLLIDRMVCQDCSSARRNISMAWINVKKAQDSIDHEWLREMTTLHKFPKWICKMVHNLGMRWNTRIKARTRQRERNISCNQVQQRPTTRRYSVLTIIHIVHQSSCMDLYTRNNHNKTIKCEKQ